MVALALALALATFAPGVAQAAPGDKELCKNGGYTKYVDPITGQPFKNQGRCISFVNSGGVLLPVEEEPEPVELALAVVEQPDGVIGDYRILIEMTGLVPNAPFSMSIETRDGRTATYDFEAYSDGTYRFSYDNDCHDEVVLDGDVIIVQGGTMITTPVPEITECPTEVPAVLYD